ncbi:MAG: FAD-binding oxidoreductase [Candidatus Anaerobiospirillum merdipullorum]|uniref:D-2-hydroxyglutarate dehydrogenase n=1 Tax=Candidatus Anaerobiospirillum merdipullorum TaxID=2838450 RepID=A0A9E2KPH2_9GAMM|nr:FAD-binding oxidoreductase [Candidatus Anaerobiospirillum merdipullorum]
MIPRIANLSKVQPLYAQYAAALRQTAFSGDIDEDYATRLLGATDNSVYQAMPQVVLFPKNEADVILAMQVGQREEFRSLFFTARGGGTGTNGQSLNYGVMLDLSRYMKGVSHLDVTARTVTVEPGVIKDELNDSLKPHGLFFSPELSTSNRATIGGMLSNDAAGQGSLKYGRTSDHIKSLRAVLIDGTVAEFGPVSGKELTQLCALPGTLGEIYRKCHALLKECRAQVLEHFPRLNRFMTGYDLYHAYDEKTDTVNLARLICGAEGTLAIVTEATLDLTVMPAYRALLTIKYCDFDSALRHAKVLIDAGVFSVETVDSKVLNLAKQDPVWLAAADYIKDDGSVNIAGINIVEFNGQDADEVRAFVKNCKQRVQAQADAKEGGILGVEMTEDPAGISAIYAMRKKAVGLLGAAAGSKKLVPFTEDTVVPPEHLADYIKRFRALLDSMQVEYGMFGHVDTGLMHVRPALDLTTDEDKEKLYAISRGVAALVKEYGGQMWGEHGRGYRACFGELFFGKLYVKAQQVKAIFDPHNRLNPGKICVPYGSGDALVPIDGPMRGDLDRTIPPAVRAAFEGALNCNGNGQCFSYQKSALMCPSYRYTKDRVRSPKGYSGLMREWLRLLAQRGCNPQTEEVELFTASPNPLNFIKRALNTLSKDEDFSHEYFEAVKTCLACKSCKTQCPAHVNAADLNSRFLFLYYSRYLRPAMDLLTLNAEFTLPLMAKVPTLSNAWLKTKLSQSLLKRLFAFVDVPLFAKKPLARVLKEHDFKLYSVDKMIAHKPDVAIICDAFTASYDAEGLLNMGLTMRAMGFKVAYLRPYVNGKLMVIRGDRKRFARFASKQAARLSRVDAAGITIVGFDPALTLCYGDEYRQILGRARGEFEVLLPEQWLATALKSDTWQAQKAKLGTTLPAAQSKLSEPYYLFCHCSEQALLPKSVRLWQEIFSALGLSIVPVKTACCGMAGLFGHMLQNQDESRRVYQQNWQEEIKKRDFSKILVTGFSCRSQVARMEGKKPLHPFDVLATLLAVTRKD